MGNHPRPHRRSHKSSEPDPNPADPPSAAITNARSESGIGPNLRRSGGRSRGQGQGRDKGMAAPAMECGGQVNVVLREEMDEKGVRHVLDGVFYRFTDIVYEWHPLLNPWQCNALKSLISSEALVHEDHPLYTKVPASSVVQEQNKATDAKLGPTTEQDEPADTTPVAPLLPGLHLHLALFPFKKVRLVFTLSQIDYLRYYISSLGLVKCTKEDVRRWKGLVRMERERVEREEERERRRLEGENREGRIGVVGKAEEGVEVLSAVRDSKTSGEDVKSATEHPAHFTAIKNTPTDGVDIVLISTPQLIDQTDPSPADLCNVEEDDEEEDDVDPRYIPLPSSKSLVFPKDIEDLVVVRFTTVDQLKLAYRNPLKVYKAIKAGTFYDDLPATQKASHVVGHKRTNTASDKAEDGKKVEAVEEEADKTRRTAIVDEEGKVQQVIEEKMKPKGYEGIELGPSSKRPPGPASTYHHAEQAYIIASQGGLPPSYVPGHEPSVTPYPIAGRAVFLTIDFEPWAMELGVILEVGWAACWFEQEKGGSFGNWEEERDQGHWIVKDHIKYRDNDSLAPARPEYYYGESDVLSLDELRVKVMSLIDDVRARCNGGPVYLVTHTAHKTLLSYGLIDLPTERFHEVLHPDGFVAPAYSTAKGNGEVFVIDTSEMIAALTNGINDNPVVTHHDMSLKDMAQTICREAPEPIEGFGHCGNDAWIHLECFLAMVQWNFDIMFSYFNRTIPDEPLSAAAAQEAADRELAEAKMWQDAIDEEEEGIPDFDAKVKALEVDIDGDGPEGDEVWVEGEQAYKVWGPPS